MYLGNGERLKHKGNLEKGYELTVSEWRDVERWNLAELSARRDWSWEGHKEATACVDSGLERRWVPKSKPSQICSP